MDLKKLINTNVKDSYLLPSPQEISRQVPLNDTSLNTVLKGRDQIKAILDGKDRRLFVVLGPCSIHDPKAAMEYAEKLKQLAERVKGQLLLVMRVYFEKPRTTVGWKGLINDPYMDDSFRIEEGLSLPTKILPQITEMGLPTATEALDPITPQYITELICW